MKRKPSSVYFSFIYLTWLTWLVCLSLVLASCKEPPTAPEDKRTLVLPGPTSSPPTPSSTPTTTATPAPTATPLPSSTPTPSASPNPLPTHRGPPTGPLLFETGLTPAAGLAERRHFFQNRQLHLSVSTLGHLLHQIDMPNFQLDAVMVPQAPIFGTYHEPGGSITLAVKLPEVFREKIPAAIRNEISRGYFKTLDFSIVVQENLSATYNREVVRLRPHFWAGPLGPHAPGTNFGGSLTAGLFQFEHPIDGDIKSDTMSPANWSIHPGGPAGTLYSPPNASVTFNNGQPNNAGWSLVLDESGERAAVTLHGIFSNAPFPNSPHSRFEAILAGHQTLDGISAAMAGDAAFASFVAQLNTLVAN